MLARATTHSLILCLRPNDEMTNTNTTGVLLAQLPGWAAVIRQSTKLEAELVANTPMGPPNVYHPSFIFYSSIWFVSSWPQAAWQDVCMVGVFALRLTLVVRESIVTHNVDLWQL